MSRAALPSRKLAGAWLCGLLLLAACGTAPGNPRAALTPYAQGTLPPRQVLHFQPSLLKGFGAAADLRSALTALFGEHTYLSALVGGAVLDGDGAGLAAWQAELSGTPTGCMYVGNCAAADPKPGLAGLLKLFGSVGRSNSGDLASIMSFAYGGQAGSRFASIWASPDNDPAVVAYAQALANGDAIAAGAAQARLRRYAGTFAQAIHGIDADIPTAVAAGAFRGETKDLTAALSAQSLGDQPAAYRHLDVSYHSLDPLAQALAAGAAARFPRRFTGDPDSQASSFEAQSVSRFQEDLLLTGSAGAASLAGRASEADAAAAEVASNSNALGRLVGTIYGPQAGARFGTVWAEGTEICLAYDQNVPGPGTSAGSAWLTTIAYTIFGFNHYLDPSNFTGVALQQAFGAVQCLGVAGGPAAQDAARQRIADYYAIPLAQAFAEGALLKYPDLVPGPGIAARVALIVLAALALIVALFLALRSGRRAWIGGRRSGVPDPGRSPGAGGAHAGTAQGWQSTWQPQPPPEAPGAARPGRRYRAQASSGARSPSPSRSRWVQREGRLRRRKEAEIPQGGLTRR